MLRYYLVTILYFYRKKGFSIPNSSFISSCGYCKYSYDIYVLHSIKKEWLLSESLSVFILAQILISSVGYCKYSYDIYVLHSIKKNGCLLNLCQSSSWRFCKSVEAVLKNKYSYHMTAMFWDVFFLVMNYSIDWIYGPSAMIFSYILTVFQIFFLIKDHPLIINWLKSLPSKQSHNSIFKILK